MVAACALAVALALSVSAAPQEAPAAGSLAPELPAGAGATWRDGRVHLVRIGGDAAEPFATLERLHGASLAVHEMPASEAGVWARGLRAGDERAFVVGRTGGVVWRGDPAERDALLAGIGAALAALPGPDVRAAFDGPVPAELGPAVALALAGEHAGARRAAGPNGGERLVRALDAFRDEWLAELRAALDAGDAGAFQLASDVLRAGWRGTEVAREVARLEHAARDDRDFARAVDAWERWRRVERARPPLFPAARGQAERGFAKQLAHHARQHHAREHDARQNDARHQAPGAETARAWLDAWESDAR